MGQRFLKRQTTNQAAVEGKGIIYDINGQVVMDSTDMMLVPKGTTADAISSYTEGHIRYNTDTNEFECFQNGALRKMRFKEPTTISQQTLGLGDAVETIFGPLDSGDADYPTPLAAQNVLVLVENVFQIATTNYTLVQNPGGSLTIVSIDSIDGGTGYATVTTSAAHGLTTDDQIAISGVETDPDDNLELLNVGDDSSSPYSVPVTVINGTQIEIRIDVTGGVPANYIANSGKIYTVGSATGPYLPGYYIQFTSAPDLGKPITVIHNFDK